MRLLLDHGARRDAPDAGNRTPEAWARANGHHRVALMLAGDGGADAPPLPVQAHAAEGENENRPAVLLTGIKALDLFCPIPRGGLVRVPFIAGAGMVVLLGELCRRITRTRAARALWTGFSQRPFDFKDWQTEMFELGLTDCVRQSLADPDATPEERRLAFHRGLILAESMREAGLDVLLVLTTDPNSSPTSTRTCRGSPVRRGGEASPRST